MNKLIVDIVLHRGVTIRIDGEKPDGPWSTGGGDDPERIFTSDDLRIGDMQVTAIDFHTKVHAANPERLTLLTSEGQFSGPLTKRVYYDEDQLREMKDAGKKTTTEFYGGELYELDEIKIHFQFELTKVMRQFLWTNAGGAWLIEAGTRSEAYGKAIRNRMKTADQTREEAESWFRSGDDLIEVDGDLEDRPKRFVVSIKDEERSHNMGPDFLGVVSAATLAELTGEVRKLISNSLSLEKLDRASEDGDPRWQSDGDMIWIDCDSTLMIFAKEI